MWRTRVVGFAGVLSIAAFSVVICALCACDADDASLDASTDDAGDATIGSACLDIADLCATELPGVSCPSTLDIADDSGTWSGNGSCTLYQSTNLCGGNDVSEAGLVIDAGDILLDIAETDTGLVLFYDSQSGQLVGAASFANQTQQQCWGVIPPANCASVTDGAACCNWSTGVLFQSFDAGACQLLPVADSGAVDAGVSDAAVDSGDAH
jgi:hypothetical protein